MSRELDRFMNTIRVRLPGALDSAINVELFNVLDEFCKETNAWQEIIPLSVNSQTREYEIEPEENRALIVRLMGVLAGDTWVASVGAFMPTPDTIVFQQAPSDGADYRAVVALTVIDPTNPGDDIPSFPDWFLTLYSLDLQDGILSKMMSQQAKPYFSQSGFIYHGTRFRNAISRVRSAVEVGNTYGKQNWRFPPFGR